MVEGQRDRNMVKKRLDLQQDITFGKQCFGRGVVEAAAVAGDTLEETLVVNEDRERGG